MAAAVAGGVTSLACPPDTDPPLDEPGLVEMLKHRARVAQPRARLSARRAHASASQGETLTEMGELAEAGCVAFSQADAPLAGHAGAAARDAVRGDVRLPRVAARRRSASRARRRRARRRGRDAARACRRFRSLAETIALATIFELVRETGARVHLCRLSSRRRRRAGARAPRREGLPVTCDVGVHHLHLCDVDIGWFDAQCAPGAAAARARATATRCARGARRRHDRRVCSDHTPVDDDGKQLPFAEAEPGATGLELLLPLALKWADEDNVPLLEALARDHVGAGRDPRCRSRQSLAMGAPADVCVFDPAAAWTVAPGAAQPGQEHAVPRATSSPARCARRWSRARGVRADAG